MNDTETLEALDIHKLLEYLPHRYPFLMVDRIIDIRGDSFGIGIKNVTINEPFFVGHFPRFPVMPGVLLIEGMAQTAGAICIHAGAAVPDRGVYFMSIDNAKFRQPVRPGDTVEHHMTKLRNRGAVWKFHGDSMVNGTKVAEADVTAMIVTD